MKVFLVAGARPNFMKIAPLYREAVRREAVDCKIVHTGQHYDHEMSETFFEELEIPRPDFFLHAGAGSHAEQTGKMMVAFEDVCRKERPDLVIVVGDVNSTLACSIVARKLQIAVAHVEAGLRSFDLSMPEEINRMVTDAISDYFLVTEVSAVQNLLNEGKSADRIHFVGHVMVDNLFHQLKKLDDADGSRFALDDMKRQKSEYLFLTLHRPSNVDSVETFKEIASALNLIAEETPVFFPVHPRTRRMIDQFGIRFSKNIICLPPLGFRESLYLWKDAVAVLTDSGGLQEETTALGVPCITIRDNTERPITVEMGTNRLAGTTEESILACYREWRNDKGGEKLIPPLWDGKASERIWDVVLGG